MTIETELEKLAEKIATHANREDVIFKDKLDSFRALTAYHFHKNKTKKDEPEDGEGETFDGFRNRVAATANGASEIGGDEPADLA